MAFFASLCSVAIENLHARSKTFAKVSPSVGCKCAWSASNQGGLRY